MNYGLIYRTVKHLRFTQVYHQIKYRLKKPAYIAMTAPALRQAQGAKGFKTEPIPRYKSLEGNRFTFLNLEHEFSAWDFTGHGMLWAYNQNYFDWLNQEGMTATEGCKWIDLFNSQLSTLNSQLSLDPYPIALRSINWIKFFCRYSETATQKRLDSLYSQLRLLEKKLEYHLLGNHLLEDAYALYIGAAYFGDERLLKKANKLLLGQLKEQILPDGAHYEQSVMYHCILLDRLLDCINIGLAVSGERLEKDAAAALTANRSTLTELNAAAALTANRYSLTELTSFAQRMLGHLESIVWCNGSIPMLNDSANGIAPLPNEIFEYAYSLGLKWQAIPMKECGYRKMTTGELEAIVDVGDIMATYQPGHSHADTFSFELRVGRKPFIVDTGVSTYDKNEYRQHERSTDAHNTVVVNGKNSSEVWGGFRIGKRAKVIVRQDSPTSIKASHDGYGKDGHQRTFQMEKGIFKIEDETKCGGLGFLHFAPGVTINDYDAKKIETDLAIIELDNVSKIEMVEGEVYTEYHKPMKTIVARLYFDRIMTYKFRKR